MITIGIDPHKRTHTAVAVSGVGQLLGEITIDADVAGQEDLLAWTHVSKVARRSALPWRTAGTSTAAWSASC